MNERPQVSLLLLSSIAGLAISFAPGPTLIGLAAVLFILRDKAATRCHLYVSMILGAMNDQAESSSRWRPGLNGYRVLVLSASAALLTLGLASVL